MKPILNIENLTKVYGTLPNQTRALNGITFQVMPGEFLGIMGSSGSGKSTLAKVLCGVCPPDAGAVTLDGQTLVSADHPYDRRLGIRIQMVYQQPYATLDPSQKIGAGFTELIRYHRFRPKGEELSLTKEMLDKAKAGKYAVGHFNINMFFNNSQWSKDTKMYLAKKIVIYGNEKLRSFVVLTNKIQPLSGLRRRIRAR